MAMTTVSEDVYQLPLGGPAAVNAYLCGQMLVDAGTASRAARLIDLLDGRTVATHVVTHAHGDHLGGSPQLLARCGLAGIAIGDRDAAAAEAGRQPPGSGPAARLLHWARADRFTPVPVTRRLQDGDELEAGFVVLAATGHTPGQMMLWRERDRMAICGDLLASMHPLTRSPGLHEPPRIFTADPPANRAAIRRLAALRPAILCPGHGPVLREAADPLAAFTRQLS